MSSSSNSLKRNLVIARMATIADAVRLAEIVNEKYST